MIFIIYFYFSARFFNCIKQYCNFGIFRMIYKLTNYTTDQIYQAYIRPFLLRYQIYSKPVNNQNTIRGLSENILRLKMFVISIFCRASILSKNENKIAFAKLRGFYGLFGILQVNDNILTRRISRKKRIHTHTHTTKCFALSLQRTKFRPHIAFHKCSRFIHPK